MRRVVAPTLPVPPTIAVIAMLCKPEYGVPILRVSCLLTVVLAAAALAAEAPAVRLCEPWKTDYPGHDATGGHVIGLWKFDGPKIEDASGHGHAATLRGAKLSPAGRFGGCLECFRGWPVQDKEHRALVQNRPRLEPQGAIHTGTVAQAQAGTERRAPASVPVGQEVRRPRRITRWFSVRRIRAGRGSCRSTLGFGADSEIWYSRAAKFPPGTWWHVAFTYDGQGEGSFYLDGAALGQQRVERRRSIAPARIRCRSATASAATTAVSRLYRRGPHLQRGAGVPPRPRRANFRPGLLPPHGIARRAAVRRNAISSTTPLAAAELSISLNDLAKKDDKTCLARARQAGQSSSIRSIRVCVRTRTASWPD